MNELLTRMLTSLILGTVSLGIFFTLLYISMNESININLKNATFIGMFSVICILLLGFILFLKYTKRRVEGAIALREFHKLKDKK
jgi:hypothetical protein